MIHFVGPLIAFMAAATSAVAAVKLPAPSGKHNIGTHIYTLTDPFRTEPHNTNQHRRILVQLFYPTSQSPASGDSKTYQYSPPATLRALESTYSLPFGLLSSIETNSYYESRPSVSRNLTPLIFSPGFGNPRIMYTSLLEDLASHGYLVASLDHPYDSLLTEFPDGTIIPSAIPANETDSVYEYYLRIRAADILHVASHLARGSRKPMGVFGHSLGGAAAARAIAGNPDRLVAGLMLDGRLFDADNNLHTPFFLMGRKLANRTEDVKIESWEAFRREQSCFNNEVSLEGFTHGTFSDFPSIAEVLGLKEVLGKEAIEALLGTVDGIRSLRIVREFGRAFWRFSLGGKRAGIVAGESKEEWKEVKMEGDVATKKCGGY